MNNKNNKAGVYIHIPFCSKKCNYCDFYSFSANDDVKKAYVNALIDHIKSKSEEFEKVRFDSVYIGGGTPTALDTSLLCHIIEAVTNSFALESDTEFTVETNPGMCKKADFGALHSLGVNRLSIGLQSANKDELRSLGRIHSLADYEQTVDAARDAGFDNISTDIMFSLPTQTLEKLAHTLDFVIATAPEHISAYSLKIEPGTPFYAARESLALPDEDTDADMYLRICDTLKSAGYCHYEISNFAKPGHESRHNLKYWQVDDYLGFGPGAHSFVGGIRYAYKRDINEYINAVTKGDESNIFSELQPIDENEAVRERLMLGLRLKDGTDDALLSHFAPLDEIYARLAPLIKSGLVIKTDRGIALSAPGMYVSNSIINLIYG